MNSGFEVIFETSYKNILNVEVDSTGKFIGVCGCEGILSSTLKFDIFEINGFSVKSIETKGEDVVTKDTKDETNEFKTQFMFRPLPRD